MHDQPALQFIEPSIDPWRTVGGEDGPVEQPAPAECLLLTQAQWQAVRDTWPAGLPVGLTLANDEGVETLEDDLPRIAVVALHFPKWTDGRAYSQARLLRARYRFAGEVRATGEVLADMMQQLVRTGFSAVQLAADQKREVAERALGFFRSHYQGDVFETRPWFAREAA